MLRLLLAAAVLVQLPECHSTERVVLRVEAPEGPVADCVVRVYDGENIGIRTGVTGAGGTVNIDLLEEGRHVVVWPVVQRFHTSDGTVVLRVPSAVPVEGTVVELIDGVETPVPGVDVLSQRPPDGSALVATTDANGAFRYLTVPGPLWLASSDPKTFSISGEARGVAPASGLKIVLDPHR